MWFLCILFFSQDSFSQINSNQKRENIPAVIQNQSQELFPDALCGVEMYYKATQMGEIEIYLTKYFGCNAVIADSTEKVTVQESIANMLTDKPILKLRSVSRETKLINVDCQGFKDGCVQKATYSAKVKVMSPMMGGYDVTLGYCCWNINPSLVNIQGIMEAREQGLTLTMHIPELAMGDTNTSPIFMNPPVITSCSGQLISINSYAFDQDNDSLVYAFSDLYDYKSANNLHYADEPRVLPGQPINQTFAGGRPPFQKVLYQKEYSSAKPLKGNQISINANTGEIQLKPETIGDFVVGISVKEYRNGKLLGTYQRVCKIRIVS